MSSWEDEEYLLPAGVARRFAARDGRIVQLRAARPADAEPLLAALNEVAAESRYLLRRHWNITPALQERWQQVAVAHADLLLVVAVADAEDAPPIIAGSLSLVRGRPEFVRHTAELGMWLGAPFREIGIGSAMVEAALAWAAVAGIEKITLSVRSSNRRALQLYQKYRFTEEGRRRAYIKTPDGYEDEVLLSRAVVPPEPGIGDAGAAANRSEPRKARPAPPDEETEAPVPHRGPSGRRPAPGMTERSLP